MRQCVVCGNQYADVRRPKTCSIECGRKHELARKKEYRESDKSRWSEYNKSYRLANKEKCATSSKRSRDRFLQTVPTRPDKRVNMLIRTCRNSARQRSLAFDLEASVIYTLILCQGEKCVLTGIPFDWQFGGSFRANPFAPSIDRIDSRKGYTYDNIQIVCYVVNLAKNQYPIEMFDRMCLARAEHLRRG